MIIEIILAEIPLFVLTLKWERKVWTIEYIYYAYFLCASPTMSYYAYGRLVKVIAVAADGVGFYHLTLSRMQVAISKCFPNSLADYLIRTDFSISVKDSF